MHCAYWRPNVQNRLRDAQPRGPARWTRHRACVCGCVCEGSQQYAMGVRERVHAEGVALQKDMSLPSVYRHFLSAFCDNAPF